jgi:hypothetical protein
MNRKRVTNEELIAALSGDTVRNVCRRFGLSRQAVYNRAASDMALYTALGTPPTSGGRWRGSRQGNAERERQIREFHEGGLTPMEISAALGLSLGRVRWWLRMIQSREAD